MFTGVSAISRHRSPVSATEFVIYDNVKLEHPVIYKSKRYTTFTLIGHFPTFWK